MRVAPPRFLSAVPLVVGDAVRIRGTRPDLAAGVRAAIATVVPFLLVPVLGEPALVWAGLQGFGVVLVDKGGPYPRRAFITSVATLGAAAAALAGSLAASHPGAAVVLVLLGVFACALAGIFGAEATGVGVSIAVMLVVSAASPVPDFHAAWLRSVCALAGGLWAMSLALVFWPIRFFRPARLRVAAALRELATLGAALGGWPSPLDPDWQALRKDLVGSARTAIESARLALAQTPLGRLGTSARSVNLLVVLESADQIFATLVALEVEFSLLGGAPDPASRTPVEAAVARLAGTLRTVAAALEDERPFAAPGPADRAAPSAEADPKVAIAGPILRRLDEEVSQLLDAAQRIDGKAAEARRAGEPSQPPVAERAPALAALKEALKPDSIVFRHALRVSIATAAAILVSRVLHLGFGYWAAITCLVVLQPFGGATLAKALQRIAGTVLGAGIAIGIAALVHNNPLAILVAVIVLIVVSIALLPLNYGIYAVFLTPAFVLMAERSSGDWTLPHLRVVNSLVGGAVALVCSWLIFPHQERTAFPRILATALSAVRELAAVAFAAAPQPHALRAARSKVGLALVNAEASVQRLLGEGLAEGEDRESVRALLVYTHRLVMDLIGLSIARGAAPGDAALAAVGSAVDEALGELEAATVEERRPRPLQSPAPAGAMQRRLESLLGQLEVLHGTAARRAALRLEQAGR